MLVLGIDTSFYYLTIVLIKDDEIVEKVYEPCQRHQSELLVGRISEIFQRRHLDSGALDAIVITKGPGSYTGVRIAMTFAKIYCSQNPTKLYTISSLQLYSGLKNSLVILDARAERCFLGVYSQGGALQDDGIIPNDQLATVLSKYPDYTLYGDLNLIAKEKEFSDISANFLLLKEKWELVIDVHQLKPQYLKEQSAYGNNQKC